MTGKGKKRQLTALSLFTGCGGMDIGVAEAGFQILAAIEVDPFCCETLRANVLRNGANTWIIEEDIRTVEPRGLMARLALKAGDLDLLFGGPPCQSFSQIGKQKGLEDERGLLLFQMPRFAEIFRPKAVLMEQVKGVLTAGGAQGTRGEVFELFVGKLTDLGYATKWQIVNAADYGIPQVRKRLFVVATRGPNGFDFPVPTHSASTASVDLFGLEGYAQVGTAIRGLGRPTAKDGKVREDSHVDVTPEGDRRRIHGVAEGEYLAGQTHLPKSQRKNLTVKDTTKFLRLSRRRPSNTLRCGEIFFHPTEDRYLTPREYMRIHGFPDDYVLRGPIRGRSGQARFMDQHRQVANAVVPPLARLIAEQIVRVLHAQDF
jgi:DNA (cytosine-5)-methyltransferase 1